MKPLGSIVRLQVQRSSLKIGERPNRVYDPSPLLDVSSLLVGGSGVTGWANGELVVDVHHAEHPGSKHNGGNGISVGFTAHYREMRQAFGARLTDGIAGENVLVETDDRVPELDLVHGLVIQTSDESIVLLDQVVAAEPCVEFSRYALGDPGIAPDDPRLREALAFLRRGTRGFYATYRGAPVRVAVGDRIAIP
jgi:hypothetical protein